MMHVLVEESLAFFDYIKICAKSLPIVLLSLLHLALVVLVFYKVISAFLLGSVVDV